MPRNVRNWWIEVDIDGQKTKFIGGPTRANGGFRLVVHQRDRGGTIKAFAVAGKATQSGQLRLYAELPSGAEYELVTER